MNMPFLMSLAVTLNPAAAPPGALTVVKAPTYALWQGDQGNDDGQENQKDDGRQNQRDDGQRNQNDDGQQGQKDDGQRNQKDDGEQNQRDDGQRNQNDDGQQGQKDDGQENQGVVRQVDVENNAITVAVRRGGREVVQSFAVVKSVPVQMDGVKRDLSDLKAGQRIALKLSQDKKTVVAITALVRRKAPRA